jgi:hypothetical protein
VANIRFGDYGEHSISSTGSLRQPFYRSSLQDTFSSDQKLTHSTNALDFYMMVGRGGYGSSAGEDGYNLEGASIGIESNTDISVDVSDFVSTGYELRYDQGTGTYGNPVATGYGTIKVKQTISGMSAAPGASLDIIREYQIPEADSRMVIMTVRVRARGAMVENVRVWMGTGDDYVGTTDAPRKELGNFFTASDGSKYFSMSGGTRSTVKVSSGSEGVFFTSPTGQAVYSESLGFSTSVVTTNPHENSLTNPDSGYDDGSYGIFFSLGDIAADSSKVAIAAYAAGPLQQLGSVAESLSAQVEESLAAEGLGAGIVRFGRGGTVSFESLRSEF